MRRVISHKNAKICKIFAKMQAMHNAAFPLCDSPRFCKVILTKIACNMQEITALTTQFRETHYYSSYHAKIIWCIRKNVISDSKAFCHSGSGKLRWKLPYAFAAVKVLCVSRHVKRTWKVFVLLKWRQACFCSELSWVVKVVRQFNHIKTCHNSEVHSVALSWPIFTPLPCKTHDESGINQSWTVLSSFTISSVMVLFHYAIYTHQIEKLSPLFWGKLAPHSTSETLFI